MGNKKQKTKSTYKPPSWVESGSRQAMEIGQRIGRKEFQPYEGQRVAGLSENERLGMEMARDSVGIGQPYIDEATSLTRRGTQSWTEADQSAYINPYVKGALDPAAREIREYGAGALRDVEDRASSMDAWGRRSQLERSDVQEKTLQGLSDLYGEGYARAYEWGADMFGEERARDMEAADRFRQLGGTAVDMAQTDISTLMTTGAIDRSIQQHVLDFDWQQFVEERDWDWKQLMGVVSALEGTKGSYSTSQTQTTEQSGGGAAAAIGAIAQVVAAIYTGGASAAVTAGASAAAGTGGAMGGSAVGNFGSGVPDYFASGSTPGGG